MTDILKNVKHVFFTGIGGIGMSGLAEILIDRGYRVSGSDRQLSDITEYLQAKGATIYQGHNGENIDKVDLLVYSSAITDSNPERIQSKKLGIPEIRRAEMLASIMEGSFKIAIAGTHGKTTTTALCAHIAIESGIDPTVVIGGKLKNLKTNARLGNGKIFITEADEYDRSFLALSPDLSVITNIEEDHLDIYRDKADIRDTFKLFTELGAGNGKVVCCIDDPQVNHLATEIKKKTITYGYSINAMYQVNQTVFNAMGCKFDLNKNKRLHAQIELNIPGRHNVLNSVAAFIVSEQLGIKTDNIIQSLKSFSGVDRRFEIKDTINGITVVDDYAHHPTEVAATISSVKSGWDRRVIAVFQPHLFSRTRDFFNEFTSALSKADLVIVSDIYPAREDPIPGISAEMIVKEAKNKGFNHFQFIPDSENIVAYLLTNLCEGDMVITMGAGDIWRCGENLIKELRNKSIAK
jgi:UDP-N-acetylmuramate--alanine ligase